VPAKQRDPVRAARTVRPRKRPVQKRSEDSVERILKYAAIILEDVGVDGFSTNEISKRSAVTIGSIYHYFPNKEAIIYELCSRWLHRVTDRYTEFEALRVDGADEQGFWSVLVEHLYRGYRDTTGLRAINRATEIWPNIKELDVRYDETVTARIATYLPSLGIVVGRPERRRLSLLILNMLHYGLMLSVEATERDCRANLEDLVGSLAQLTRQHRRT
jgi:AcrR family transcriptional regulator